MHITEHVEGDECKFVVCMGAAAAAAARHRPSVSSASSTSMPQSASSSASTAFDKLVLRAPNIDVKLVWVKRLREMFQNTIFSNAKFSNVSTSSLGSKMSVVSSGTSKSRFSR